MWSGGADLDPAADYDRILGEHSSLFLWTSPRYYFPARKLWQTLVLSILQKEGGPLKKWEEYGVEAGAALAAPGAVKA